MRLTKRERVINMIALGGTAFVFLNKGVVAFKGKETILGDRLFWRLVKDGVIESGMTFANRSNRDGWRENKKRALEISGIIVTPEKKDL